jgi:hypothetical protein
VHRGGVQRPRADFAVGRLDVGLRGRHGDHQDVAVPAGVVAVHPAGDHHDVIGDRREGHVLLDPADFESVSDGTDFGLDGL